MAEDRVPALLASLFVCITFKWNVQKLVYLQQVLRPFDQFPTCVTICIVTDNAAGVELVLSDWPNRRAQVCLEAQENQPYDLLWEHRQVMADAYKTGKYTTYLYGEDDQAITWPAMKAWAYDTIALQATRHQRGFLRTEVSQSTGKGIWVATHDLLGKFMQSEWWSKEAAMNHSHVPTGDGVWYPDMTTWGIQFVDVPSGYASALMVPWDPITRSPARLAEVKHLRNGYTSNVDSSLGLIEFKDLVDEDTPTGSSQLVA
ncbi:hypothetical protein WJX82_009515 [Trebouxia sp. C0006]